MNWENIPKFRRCWRILNRTGFFIWCSNLLRDKACYRRCGSRAHLVNGKFVMFWLISTPPGIAGALLTIWYLAWAALLWVVVAAVAIVNHAQLTRQPLRRQAA